MIDDFTAATIVENNANRDIRMKLRLEDEFIYDHLTMEWLYEIAAIMKPHLLEAGLTEVQAEEVGGNILFDLAMLHDQSDIEGMDDKNVASRFVPRISFVNDEGDLLTTDEDSFLHEYAFGANSSAYEEES